MTRHSTERAGRAAAAGGRLAAPARMPFASRIAAAGGRLAVLATTPLASRLAGAAAGLVVSAGAFASGAAAQCSMCGQATAYAGKTPAQAYATFAGAALVLLVPVLILSGALALLLWKNRHAPGSS